MKKGFTVGLAIVLSFVLFTGTLFEVVTVADADSEDVGDSSKETDGDDAASGEPGWTLGSGGSGGGCWVDISGHGAIDLGSYSFGSGTSSVMPGDTIDSTNVGNGQKKIQVKTNCKDTLTTSVYPSDFSLPSGHPVTAETAIQDFAVTADQGDLSGDYTSFSGIGNEAANTITVDSYTGPSTKNYVMDYQYEIDENDVSGDYTVSLIYTVST